MSKFYKSPEGGANVEVLDEGHAERLERAGFTLVEETADEVEETADETPVKETAAQRKKREAAKQDGEDDPL